MGKSKRPTQEDMLWKLHSLLAQRFLEILESDKPVKATTLAIMVEFLKQNDIRLASIKEPITENEAKAFLQEMSLDKLPFA